METIFSLAEIEQIAEQILSQKHQKIILFYGEMGVGKTTLIKEICKKLGVVGSTSSPTFSLVNEYQTIDNQIVYHFDCYRLKNENEAINIGIDDYLYSGNYCLIEWAEKIPNLIPNGHTIIKISLLEDGQRLLKLD